MTEKILEHLLEARKLLTDVQDVKENRHAMGFLDEAIKWQREIKNSEKCFLCKKSNVEEIELNGKSNFQNFIAIKSFKCNDCGCKFNQYIEK